MKKILSTILVCSILNSVSATASTSNPFTDVSKDVWYHDAVVEAVNTGIINGKSTTEFKPDDLLTYAEAIKLAACMNQVYATGKVTLTNGDPWYQSYVDFCKSKNIITKDYNFNENATRAGYMEIFAKALPESAFSTINTIPAGSILDVDDNNPYASAVYKLYRAGIVTGVDESHNCNPDANIKRCEVATIISRMLDESKRQKFNMPNSDDDNNHLSNIGTIEDDDSDNENKTTVIKNTITDDPIITTPDITIKKIESTTVIIAPEQPQIEVGDNDLILDSTKGPLDIDMQPVNFESENYSEEYDLKVHAIGGKPPYTYEWYYNGYRNQKTKIEESEYAKGADSQTLTISIEKENTLLGKPIFAIITDSEGTSVTSKRAQVYGPFSVTVEQSLSDSGKYTLVGRIQDGTLKKGEKISVIRNDKVIAIGVAEDLQMFNKSIDEIAKDDNAGIVFNKESGVRPIEGDTVVKYQSSHVLDTSDIVN